MQALSPSGAVGGGSPAMDARSASSLGPGSVPPQAPGQGATRSSKRVQ
ncbi:hypothetical protein HJC22_43185 [Corallococcus exiguus]|nr:hypothetical protein [Corallococcus exiguus]NPC76526.1 hypothetical protein [Corallococcus exiguus]